MDFKLLPAIAIFVGSYLPLSLILLVQDIREEDINKKFCFKISSNCDFPKLSNPELSISFFVVCLVSYCFLRWHFFRKIRPSKQIKVINSKPIPNDLINYVFPYVVSFMSIDYSDSKKIAGFFIFFCWMFYITFKSGQILMNPLILSFGWKLHEAYIEFEKVKLQVRMLSKSNLGEDTLHNSCVVQGVYVLKSD